MRGGVKGSWHYLNLGGSWDDLIGDAGIVGIGMPNCLKESILLGLIILPNLNNANFPSHLLTGS